MVVTNRIIRAASYGSDLTAVNTARVSFGKESREFTENDGKLLKYLIKHRHWSPIWSQYLFFEVAFTEASLRDLLLNKPPETFIIGTDDPCIFYLVISVLGLKSLKENSRSGLADGLIKEINNLNHPYEHIFSHIFPDLPKGAKEHNLFQLDRHINRVKNLLPDANLGSVELLTEAKMSCSSGNAGNMLSSGNNKDFLNWYRFRLKAPIFVLRQLVKHRIGLSWNELSMRYVSAADTGFYAPTEFRAQSENNKQCSTDYTFNKSMNGLYPEIAVSNLHCMDDVWEYKLQDIYAFYEVMLKEGVAKEQARSVLPVATHSTVLLTISKPALDNMIDLRTHEGAQYETRLFVEALKELTNKEH